MNPTMTPTQADPPHVLITQADEELARAYEQITHADEEIARAEEQLSKLEHDATRRGNRRSFGGRAVRGFTGLTLTAFIGVAAYVWQSSSYGLAAGPSPSTVQAAAPETAPPQPGPPAP